MTTEIAGTCGNMSSIGRNFGYMFTPIVGIGQSTIISGGGNMRAAVIGATAFGLT